MSRKLALIIGNTDYANNPLQNCVNDATSLAKVLREVVDCQVELKTNLNSEDMYKCIKEFTRSIKPNDFVIFFYAGHGRQWGGQNFLLPCNNNKITSDIDVQCYGIDAQTAVDDMAKMNPHIVLFLLDCCYSYWMPATSLIKTAYGQQQRGGLNRMKAPQQTMIVFACAASKVVSDKIDGSNNSLFTKYLLKHIRTPGKDIASILQRVIDDVDIETEHSQIPYQTSSINLYNAYLVTHGSSSPLALLTNVLDPTAYNKSTHNSQVRQPSSSLTCTPSTQKQDVPNSNQQFSLPTNNPKQVSSTNKTVLNDISTDSKTSSSPAVPIVQQPSLPNQKQEENDTPASLPECSVKSTMTNKKLQDLTNVVVGRNNPLLPLYSTKSFEQFNLNPDLLKGIYNMSFRAPSEIQESVLPHLLNNLPRNIIAQSQSGTGKTAAFSIATISRIDPYIKSPQALILAPTFELALQIGSVIENLAKFLPYIQIAYAVLDQAISKTAERVRGQLLREPIVVGTFGTVKYWCENLKVIDLKELRVLVIDEADAMIATEDFLKNRMGLVKNLNISHCQMMLFSATYSDEIIAFARQIVPAPVVLTLKRNKQMLRNVRQFLIFFRDPQDKYAAIEHIYTSITVGQAIIFCGRKKTADDLAVELANRMSKQNHSVGVLKGNLGTEERVAVLQRFRDGQFRVLISTDITARGIDIKDVSLIINYDIPETMQSESDYETYLHRIGRCGRFGRQGYVFNLIDSLRDKQIINTIAKYFDQKIEEIKTEDIYNLEPDED
ncbi:unnamed protein product [Adineta steineri]|uniref:RNA helicase n=1 Tax=Adineta steineri TaxID=433720 RepID=A0A815SK25_9BILA|nr:unnamed protein product [Adineta steineri]